MYVRALFVLDLLHTEVAKIDEQSLQSRTPEAYSIKKGVQEPRGVPMRHLDVPMECMYTNLMQNSVERFLRPVYVHGRGFAGQHLNSEPMARLADRCCRLLTEDHRICCQLRSAP